MKIHFKQLLALGAAACLLSGCAGYHLGPVGGSDAGEKSVAVLPFNNQTLEPRLGDAVTQAVRERLQVDGTCHLATRGDADVVVSGVIKSYGRQALSYLNRDVSTPENYRIGITAHVVARERSSGKVLFEKDLKGYTLLRVGDDLASASREAQPLLAEDLARNVVEQLTENAW